MNSEPPLSAEGVLRFHLESGVDECIGEQAVDRYRQPQTEPQRVPDPEDVAGTAASVRPSAPDVEAAPAKAPVAGEGAVRSAVALAREATSLEEVRAALSTFDGCPLSKTATNLVFGDGNPEARLVFIGEAPGAEEDRRGLPFVGPSGRLLDRMLGSIGLDRSHVFISNTVFWRPPGNRSPTTGEIATCMPFLERMLELIDPQVLVAVGGPAATALLGMGEGVGKLRGRWFPYQTPRMSRPVQATAIFHPAYLLRTPGQKCLAWRDLLAIQEKLAAF